MAIHSDEVSANDVRPTAAVVGGGPSGLSSACALAQEGWQVTVFEKRSERPPGEGRKNMVAIRPEGLHQLDVIGALEHVRPHLTRMIEGVTRDMRDGSEFVWPLDQQVRYPAEDGSVYKSPEKLDDQFPSYFVNLGHLEDSMTLVGRRLGVKFVNDCSARIQLSPNQSDSYLLKIQHLHKGGEYTINSDLIVIASGKAGGDELENDLGIERHTGVELVEDNLPLPGSRILRLPKNSKLESQRFCVLGMRSDAKVGVIDHVVREVSESEEKEHVVEIEMAHASASHLLIQLPRNIEVENDNAVKQYVVGRINDHLKTNYADANDVLNSGALVWGNFTPVVIETNTTPTFVYGTNVILIGDAAMSCSPSSGLGADIGMTHDAQAVRKLGVELRRIMERLDVTKSDMRSAEQWQQALTEFNKWKAHGVVYWSKGSRKFYMTKEEAQKIVQRARQ